MQNERGFDSVRLSSLELERVLNALDQGMFGRGTQKPNRRRPRLVFRQTSVLLTIQTYGGGTSNFLVCTRNLSKGGVSVLHGGFVHPGTGCRIVLRTLDGERHALEGKVVQCRFIEGRVHELGVKFTTLIDLGMFCVNAPEEPEVITTEPKAESDACAEMDS